MFWGQKASIHLIGIGGSGMSAVAEVLLGTGFPVSGSDMQSSATTQKLKKLGAKIFEGHHEDHLKNPTCVVVSSAISQDNPEWRAAIKRGIPVIPRAEMLAELMRLKMGVAIAGSHGKTTTTSMVGQVLRSMDPTVVVGGRLQHWNASSVVGRGALFVIEADESDRSFLKFSPVYSVVTNIDREHLDTYRDLSDIETTFLEYLNRTAFFGMNWICGDCPSLLKIRSQVTKPVRTYGLSETCDLRITEVEFLNRESKFELKWEQSSLGVFELSVVGVHNVLNATAAVGIALSLGLSPEIIKDALKIFVPADRRLQIHVDTPEIVVVEDYGHHPTEIAATLEALYLMFPSREIVTFFQPHRYSRTKALFDDFAPSLERRSAQIFLMPIYAAHEASIQGVTSETLAKTFKNKNVHMLKQIPQAKEALELSLAKAKNPVILILGAGPLTSLAVGLRDLVARPNANLSSG